MDDREERIRRRAYEIWEREGRAGSPEDHWYRAERELDAESSGDRSSATVESAPPASAVRAMEEADQPSAAGEAGGKKTRRRKS